MVEELKVPIKAKKIKKGPEVLKAVSMQYFGIVLQFLHYLTKRCARETRELSPFIKGAESNWVRTGDVVLSKGETNRRGKIVAPFPHDPIPLLARYYSPSHSTED